MRWRPAPFSLCLLAACSTSASPSAPHADAGHATTDSGHAVDAHTHAPDARTPDATGPATDATDASDASDASDAAPPFDAFTFDAGDQDLVLAPWNTQAAIFVDGFAAASLDQIDCRTQICQHNEDTDMIAWNGAIFMVHRTARAQILGPNSALLVYRSMDGGASFQPVARIDAPMTPIDANDSATAGRDIRDPAFFIVKDASGTESLHLKAITRLPTNIALVQTRDTGVDSISVGMSSADGTTWSPLARLAPDTWSFWRVKEVGGVFYSAAYHDGDSSVSLFSSPDGVTWTQGAQVFGITADTPLETELVPMPNGTMLALVRTDGSNADLPGNDGNQRTQVCWAKPPYASWSCPETILGERFDGPVAFFWQGRLFVIARRHVDTNGVRNRKRTSLFELAPAPTVVWDGGADAGLNGDGAYLVPIDAGVDGSSAASGDWTARVTDGGAEAGAFDDEPTLAVKWWGDLPSAGDTAYAGVAFSDATHVRVVWYAGDTAADVDWYTSMIGPTNIWLGTLDLTKVHGP